MSDVYPSGSAAAAGLVGCHTCGKVQPQDCHRCPRCGDTLHLRKPASLQRTLSLTLAACVLYVPANTLPIMTVQTLQGEHINTILGGVVTFWNLKAYPVAIVIFVASVVIPILKIFFLFWLCWQVKATRPSPKRASQTYGFTELVGRWSMVDVFVVAILVAVVQIGNLMSIQPGGAAAAFAAVVILTMFAADSFDPRLIWDADARRRASPPPTSRPSDAPSSS